MINKNISIWRGSATPPTNYHLWEKEDGGLYVYLDEKWQHLVTPADKTILDKHQQQLDKIKNIALTEIDPIDTNTYKSYQLKSDDNIFGTTINIPKDRFIKQVTLGYDNATIDESTGIITIGTGLSKEYLLFSVALESGSYELVSINLTNFLTEKDYSDGLEVVDNKLKVKVDPSSEEYLEVTNNGIKVEGIDTNFNKVNERLTTISNTQIKRSEMGVANGIATLDNNGTIPYNQLPAIADDEDLIEVNNRLKLKNRVYDPDNFSGKGYVILRKNIINDKNILTQDMINEPNTVYEIRYDFDLDNQEIIIKGGCSLYFKGGSLNNGIMNLNYATLLGEVRFNNTKLHNLTGKITATNLGLKDGDSLSDFIGSGWGNVIIDLENVSLKGARIIFRGQDKYSYTLRNWNINCVNTIPNPTQQNPSDYCIIFNESVKTIVENCTFDGTGSTEDYVSTNFYWGFNALSIYKCPVTIVKNSTFKNLPAECGIFAEEQKFISIINNTFLNCSIRKITNDTAGNAVYIRTTDKAVIKNNRVSLDDTIQIGRCGICFELRTQGDIIGNDISGYDRGIHVENCDDRAINIINNKVNRCVSALLLWGNANSKILVSNNVFSNKDMDYSNPNNNTPLTYARAIVNLFNVSATSTNENRYLIFKDNIIRSYEQEKYTDYYNYNTQYSGKIINNVFERIGNHKPSIKGSTFEKNIFYFTNNKIETKGLPNYFSKITLLNNEITMLSSNVVFVPRYDNSEFIYNVQNNTIKLSTDIQESQGAVCVYYNFSGIFKNNIVPFMHDFAPQFANNNIIDMSVIDDNIFVKKYDWEEATIFKDSISNKLLPGKNIIKDEINSTVTIVDNPVSNFSKYGTFANKPNNQQKGFQYFNTDTHKMITWDGSKWWNPDGTEATS